MQGSLEHFLEQVARRGSWIGGGAVAACSVALSAALLEKLIPAPQAARRLRAIRQECLRLLEADARTFAGVIHAIREEDRAAFRRSLKAATEIPWRVFAHAQTIQAACRVQRRTMKPRFDSDLVCALAVARGAAQAAAALIRTNLAWLRDPQYTAQMRRRMRDARRQADARLL